MFLHVQTTDGRMSGFAKSQCAYYFPHRSGTTWVEFGHFHERVVILAEVDQRWFLGPVEVSDEKPGRVDAPGSTRQASVPHRPSPQPPSSTERRPDKRQVPCPFMSTSERIVGLFKPIGIFREITPENAARWLYRHLGHVPSRAEHALANAADEWGADPGLPEDEPTEEPSGSEEPPPAAPDVPNELPDLVTLDQAAAAVCRSKRTLEHYKTKGTLPDPAIEGAGGRPSHWRWGDLRPWLEETFGVPLPQTFPRNRKS
jgi:hypothetical protein